jgi:peptide/nickel transport system substrate-binding protein
VRQAINYAIDKETIVQTLFGGLTEVSPGQHFQPFTFGYNPDVEAYPYDPDKARELLAEAGYPDGFTLNFETTDGRAPLDKAVAEIAAAYLADVGITAEIELIDTEEYLARFHDPTLRSPLRQGFWAYVPLLDADLVLTWFQCDQPREWHCDPEYDEAYQASVTELDPAKRLALLQEAIKLVHDNPPDVYLFAFPDIFGLSPNVGGFEPRPDGLMWFDDLEVQP